MSRQLVIVSVVAIAAAVANAGVTPGPAVTDATVVARIGGALSPSDHLALSVYYSAKAKAEAPRIEATEQLFRAYMQLEGKPYEPLKEQARKLLRAARESRKRYELLAAAHQTLAFEQADDGGAIGTPTPGAR